VGCYPTMGTLQNFFRRIDILRISTIIDPLNNFLVKIADRISDLLVCIHNEVTSHFSSFQFCFNKCFIWTEQLFQRGIPIRLFYCDCNSPRLLSPGFFSFGKCSWNTTPSNTAYWLAHDALRDYNKLPRNERFVPLMVCFAPLLPYSNQPQHQR
jgi:hypothetical protein